MLCVHFRINGRIPQEGFWVQIRTGNQKRHFKKFLELLGDTS